MDAFFNGLFADPLKYIEYIFAFMGAVGVVTFLAGWGSGMPHLFTFSQSDSHMEHARERVTWGLLMCMVTLGLWEIVRVALGEAPISYLVLSFFLLTPLWIPWLKSLFK